MIASFGKDPRLKEGTGTESVDVLLRSKKITGNSQLAFIRITEYLDEKKDTVSSKYSWTAWRGKTLEGVVTGNSFRTQIEITRTHRCISSMKLGVKVRWGTTAGFVLNTNKAAVICYGLT